MPRTSLDALMHNGLQAVQDTESADVTGGAMIAIGHQPLPTGLTGESVRLSPHTTFTAINSADSAHMPITGAQSTSQQGSDQSRRQQSLMHILSDEQEQDSLPHTTVHLNEHRSPSQVTTLPAPASRSPCLLSEEDVEASQKRKGSISPISQDLLSKNNATSYNRPVLPPRTSLVPIHDDYHSVRDTSMASGSAETRETIHGEQQRSNIAYSARESLIQDRPQWFPPPLTDPQSLPTLQSSVSDEQFREALVRETRGSSDSQSNAHAQGYATSPNEGSYHDGYSDQNLTQHQQDENKKRKRNFSNRTKTGCMTCRRRKKKCDEQRPECQNCVRGGFECNGYTTTRMWPTTSAEEAKALPIPLQAKDMPEGSAILPPSYNGLPSSLHLPPVQDRRDPLHAYSRRPQTRVDTQQPPKSMLLDERLSASSFLSGTGHDPRMTSATSFPLSSTFTTPVSGQSLFHSMNEYRSMRPILLDQPEQHRGDSIPPYVHQHGLAQINILNSPQPLSSPLLPGTSVQDAARLALSHPASRLTSQKQAMMSGQQFCPDDKELTQDRVRCEAACWQFNNSHGVSLEERGRLFRRILAAEDFNGISPMDRCASAPGRVGQEIIVDGPFHCDYGYNIDIGDAVAIGKNCTIMDACRVTIGNKTVLGPNVNIYTEFLNADPRQRAGSSGPRYAARITIEDNCFIGGGVTILPGRTIGRGATVGAGSIVTRDVAPNTVVAGNPAKILRTVFQDGFRSV